ncbi:hypothetical protein N136_04099, partial [Leifsonia aquatica ATCC 14665]
HGGRGRVAVRAVGERRAHRGAALGVGDLRSGHASILPPGRRALTADL